MNLVFMWERERSGPPTPNTHACAHTSAQAVCASALYLEQRYLCVAGVGGGREGRRGCGGWVVNVCCFLGRSNLACGEVASPLPEFWLVCPSSVLW